MKNIKKFSSVIFAIIIMLNMVFTTVAAQNFTKQIQPNPHDFYNTLTEDKEILTQLANNCVNLYKQGNIPEKSQSFAPYPQNFPRLENIAEITDTKQFCIEITEDKSDPKVYIAIPIESSENGETRCEMRIFLTQKQSEGSSNTIRPCGVSFVAFEENSSQPEGLNPHS